MIWFLWVLMLNATPNTTLLERYTGPDALRVCAAKVREVQQGLKARGVAYCSPEIAPDTEGGTGLPPAGSRLSLPDPEARS